MNNRQLAETFTLIANLSEIKGEVIYKTLAYRRAAENLASLSREASEYWKEGKLEDIPGVGKAIAEKIDELLRTGKLQFLEKLKKEVPASLAEWLQVPSLKFNRKIVFRGQTISWVLHRVAQRFYTVRANDILLSSLTR